MIETVRSIVHAWETDLVQHFTTAFYFRAMSTASAIMLDRLGVPLRDDYPPTRFVWARFFRELRAGDAYHVASGLIGGENGHLRLGHNLFNSETGDLCTRFVQLIEAEAPAGGSGDGNAIEWDASEPDRKARAREDARWAVTSAGLVRPEDADRFGRLDFTSLIHLASDANVQFQNMIGMTSSYMRESRIGFSTAEYQLTVHGELPPIGTPLQTRSALAHLGRTSLSFVHEVFDRRVERKLLTLAQLGVHLDLVARRPSPVPDHIRARIGAMPQPAG